PVRRHTRLIAIADALVCISDVRERWQQYDDLGALGAVGWTDDEWDVIEEVAGAETCCVYPALQTRRDFPCEVRGPLCVFEIICVKMHCAVFLRYTAEVGLASSVSASCDRASGHVDRARME